LMLTNGVETSRAEDSVLRVCTSRGYTTNIFAIAFLIFTVYILPCHSGVCYVFCVFVFCVFKTL
ncbi:hypothetical protein, partial [Clostridium sp. 1001270J_160509_D11]|uniref:hypothetical protein n=1 Tax=Clostridium sp. 1001270J_160509_D11 TaxID=2787103 RepID=UPI00325FC188